MQIVAPIDIEDALRIDVGAIMRSRGCDALFCAPPAPDHLRPDTVCFTSLGGSVQSEAGNDHGISVDCWASTDAAALRLCNSVCGIVTALPLFEVETGTHYTSSDVGMPYLNPDPQRPNLPRATFNCNIGARGALVEI